MISLPIDLSSDDDHGTSMARRDTAASWLDFVATRLLLGSPASPPEINGSALLVVVLRVNVLVCVYRFADPHPCEFFIVDRTLRQNEWQSL
jgi:hypothetical protein